MSRLRPTLGAILARRIAFFAVLRMGGRVVHLSPLDPARALVRKIEDSGRFQNVRLNYQVEGRGELASWAGLLIYYVQIPFAVAGLVVLVRRRIPVSPLLGLAAVITITAAITFGVTRYRVPVDVMIAILAAVGIERLVAMRWPTTDRITSSLGR